MPDATVAHYTFVPWTRRGVANRIAETDLLAAAAGAAVERPTLAVELVLGTVAPDGTAGPPASFSKTIGLVGPGDVLGLKPGTLLRTVPFDGEINVARNLLAFAEFYEEDFPWRYSPAKAAGDRLRPWLALIVLEEGEFTLTEPLGERPYIEIPAASAPATLPPERETWAWAHVQIAGVVGDPQDVDAAVAAAPDRSLSRIVCPRALQPRRQYHGFIIPTFETGRLAGLGSSTAGVIAQAPAWLIAGMPHSPERANQFPVYHHFRFKTGDYGDFESLARILKPGPAGQEFGKRPLDVSQPGFGLDGASATGTVALEGALMPPDFERTAFPASPGTDMCDRLEEIVDLSEDLASPAPVTTAHPFGFAATVPDDPIVTPPAYGKAHAGVLRIGDVTDAPADPLAWVRELNLDPRSRAAAGLGVQVVQRRQEELMERAWLQVGDIEAANQRLREAELASSVSERLLDKHLAGAEQNRLLALTGPLQRSARAHAGELTFEGQFRESRVPAATRSATFKRVSRPQRSVARRVLGTGTVAGLQARLIERMNEEPATALSTAPPRPDPAAAVSFATAADAVQSAISDFSKNEDAGRQLYFQLLQGEVAARLAQVPPADLRTLTVAVLTVALHARLDVAIPPPPPPTDAAVRTKAAALIDAIGQIVTDGATLFTVTIPSALFDAEFGHDVDGKSYRGVIVQRAGAPASPVIAPLTSLDEVEGYASALGQFNTDLLSDAARPPPPVPPALAAVTDLSRTLLSVLAPSTTIAARVRGSVGGLPPPSAQEPRQLRPVMAYPVFADPEFADLRQIGQDYVIPNFGKLAENSLTLLVSNQRFIEAFMAGLNTEMGRELLWRAFPTDQRGTYFRKFWDTRDDLQRHAAQDIRPITEWAGMLGEQAERAGGFLVLVVRGQLLEKYPNTVVYARRARFQADSAEPRLLADDAVAGNVLYPAFQGELEPDVALFGFALDVAAARGHRPLDPGWFFVLQERPGQVQLGLDDPIGPLPPLPLASWDELSWGHIQFPPTSPNHIDLAHNAALAVAGAGAADPRWGRTSADMAHLLLQNPILLARHAEEMLPPDADAQR